MFDDLKFLVSKIKKKKILFITKKNPNFYKGFKLIKTEGYNIFSPNKNRKLENKFEMIH